MKYTLVLSREIDDWVVWEQNHSSGYIVTMSSQSRWLGATTSDLDYTDLNVIKKSYDNLQDLKEELTILML